MKKIVVILFVLISLLNGGCWDTKQKADIETQELDDYVVLSFKAADNCEAIEAANVTLKFKGYNPITLKTNQFGELEIPKSILEKFDDSKVQIKVVKSGYIPYKIDLDILMGSLWKKYFLISPRLAPESVRFVLSWGEHPQDMDLHLVTSDYHISYRNKKSISGVVNLDQDARYGFGAETITIQKVNPYKTYKLFVKQYSHDGNIDNKVKVAVYIDNQLDKIISLPSTSHKVVKVLTLKDGEIIYNNQPMDRISY